ncbi:MAG: glycosyltransferase family 2 protein [Anaerolineaceae bacterium]|nr:glycosyltransferase family 2 protein [Anaerolineaceae bacterium]MCB9100225.1 glycosyltransferase family 2 protein [Anaerolineales bacterium]
MIRCLPTLFSQDYPHFEVIVIDNGSTDGLADWLRADYPQVTLIPNGENLGYCTATNQGIAASRGEYIIVLDDDTVLEPGFLSAMVAAAQSADDIGMVASQIVLDHAPGLIDSAGIEVDWAGLAWNRHIGQPAANEPAEPVEVFGPAGAGGLYARRMLDQIGWLDEDYFIYYDDSDIAWRGQRAGWRCLYAPQAKVRHVHSATSGKWSPFKTYLLGRNKLWTMIKNYPLNSFLLYLPVILAYEIAAIFYSIFILRSTAALRGRLAALKRINLPLAKRRQFNQSVPTRPVKLASIRTPKLAWKLHRTIPH